MRLVLAALLVLAAAAPAGAQVRLARGDAELHALAVRADGRALAVVDSPDRERPFALVGSSGGPRTVLGTFGVAGAEFPDVADGFVSWARPISGGAELAVAPLGRLGAGAPVAFATGPGRLAGVGDMAVLAFPDETGDAALAVGDAQRTLSADAPERRHLPLDVAVGTRGAYVLDLAQRRGASELRVLGPGAPGSPVVAVGAVRHIDAQLAVEADLIAVAYLSRGRAVLATARAGGGWNRRRLRGPGGGAGAPAVAIADGTVHVAYAQRVDGDRELFTATLAGGRLAYEQLTVARGDDRNPFAAAGPAGDVYVGWTRRTRGPARSTPYLERLG